MFDCFWLSVPVQLIAWKDSSPNDLLCVEWDVKPYTLTHSLLWCRLRELSNIEKQENQRLQKQSDDQKSEISSLTKDREKLHKDVGRLEDEIIELKEQVHHRYSVLSV